MAEHSEAHELLERLEYGQRKLRKILRQQNSTIARNASGTRRTSGGKRPASPILGPTIDYSTNSSVSRVQRPTLRHVDTLPRKRARLVNLTFSTSSPPKNHTRVTTNHRRLSSTPKTTSAPSPDLSLEEALFEEDRRNDENHNTTSVNKEKGLNLSQTAQNLCDGSRRKKGLNVSFQLVNKSSEHSCKKTPLQSFTTSRYGALGQQQHRLSVIPRKHTGEELQLLGYDWIAGLMDAGPCTSQYSDQHLQDLKEFRHVNSSECYLPTERYLFPEPNEDICSSCVAPARDDNEKEASVCMPSYVLNDRLFPMPINPDACPTCQGHSDSKLSTTSRYIQISVPHSTLQAPYKLRPRSKLKNSSAASMSLSQHCQSGWQTARPTSVPPKAPADLQSFLDSGVHRKQDKTTKQLLNTSHAVEYSIRRLPEQRLR